jgi:urease accessory protein
LSFRHRGGTTFLHSSRFEHPLQVLGPFQAIDGSVCVMMLNISGGMLGGDRLTSRIELGPEAHAVLTTASAAKAYRTQTQPALQDVVITLGENATVEYLPDHLIPYAGAWVDQKLRIEMARGSRAIIYDSIAAGRIAHSERWHFRELNSETLLTRNEKPIYLNRARIMPASQPLGERGWMENYGYLATMVIVGDGDYHWNSFAASLHQALQGIEGVRGSASVLADGGCVARFMSTTADSQYRSALELWAISRRELIGREAFPLRKL